MVQFCAATGVHAVSQIVLQLVCTCSLPMAIQLVHRQDKFARYNWPLRCPLAWNHTCLDHYTLEYLAQVCTLGLIGDNHCGMDVLHDTTHLLAPALNSTSMI